MNKHLKILVAIPETAGDVFIMTGVIDGLKKKYPEAHIYVATQERYFPILKDNPNIFKVFEYHESMLNYRNYESFAMMEGIFDFVFCPFIITQQIPHWIHGGRGEWMGRCYADMCHVEYGEQFIGLDDSIEESLPDDLYITVQSQTTQGPKDFDFMQEILNRIKNFKIVHIGGAKDKALKVDVDLRGKTTPQQLAYVLKKAVLHIGFDSFPMHVAGFVGVPSVILFGGTYAKQGIAPHYTNVHPIETTNRGPCITSCHLAECEVQAKGGEKCINNIPVDDIVAKIGSLIGVESIIPPEPVKISSYMIIKDGIKYGFPFERAIAAALKVSDEVVIVDGGSTDLTWEQLQGLGQPSGIPPSAPEYIKYIWKNVDKIKVLQHKWNIDNPTLFGDEKTYARQQCTGNWLIQLDADEIISEPEPGMIRKIIERNKNKLVLDFPCINFYGDDKTIRIEDNFWKWRISRNDPNIIHGVHAEARIFDPETGGITMDKKVSDSCEYIHEDTAEIVNHYSVFPRLMLETHELFKARQINAEEYLKELDKILKTVPVVFHYSWLDLNRKKNNGTFWDETYHGKQDKTHNTTKDIEKRISKKKDLLIKVNFDHPMKGE